MYYSSIVIYFKQKIMKFSFLIIVIMVKKTEDIMSYRKEYYKTNKEKLMIKASMKIECQYCGRMVSLSNLRCHQKSTTCQCAKKKYLQKLTTMSEELAVIQANIATKEKEIQALQASN